MKDRYSYVAIFTYDKDGIAIEFPDLPGCYPCADKDDLPTASTITNISLAENQVPVLIEVFMPPIRERINSKFVKKTLSLPAWLAAKADEDGVNCSRLFQKALLEYLGVSKQN